MKLLGWLLFEGALIAFFVYGYILWRRRRRDPDQEREPR